MPLHKAKHPAHASPEHMIAQQAQYLTHKYKAMFTDQSGSKGSSNRHLYNYPPSKESITEGELRALEDNMAKGGHNVPLSSGCSLLDR